MTACTNHGGKARRVVTAALVGVLSVGTVPMAALATGAESGDGIQTLASSWATDAKVTAAEDGKGAAYAGDLTKPVSFDLGSGKYLVPTAVTNQNGDTTYLIDDDSLALKYGVPFLTQSASWDAAAGCWNGLINGGQYKIDGKGDVITLSSNQVSAEFAASYFAGTLTDRTGKPVKPVAGSYVAIVTDGIDSVTQSFSIVAEDVYAGTYAYYGPTGSSDIVYTGSKLNAGDIQFKLADGTPLRFNTDYDTVTWYRNNGKVDDVKDAGDYTAVLEKGGKALVTVNFAVQKYDVSKYGAAFVDQIDGSSNAAESVLAGQWGKDAAKSSFLSAVVGSWTSKFEITDITAPSGVKGFDGSYGEYTVTVKAKDGLPNFTGERTYTFSRVNKSLYNESGMDLYYGSQDVTTSNIVNINLTEGQAFDASSIKVREADGAPSYSGDQLEVTYKNSAGKTVEASDLSKADTYTVTVRVKPFQDENGTWFGGTESFNVVVKGNEAYGDNVAFYIDGEVAGTSGTLEYDGTDLLERVSAKVSNPEGGQFELGTDFELEAKNSKGEVVDSVVDAGEYTVSIKPITIELGSAASEYEFTLEVTPRQLDSLNDYTYTEGRKPWLSDDYAGHSDEAVAWTGSAVEVPGVQYWDDDAEAYVTLDPSLYNVVSIKQGDKVVKEAVDEGTYTVRIALSDEAKSNYSLADREFTFLVKKYSPFDDVKSPAWYAQVVNTAKYTNVVNGISGTSMYAPDAEISRKDAVCIIFNMAGGDSWDGENDFTYSENGGWYTGFGDCDGNAYYAKALAWAHNLGIANGSNGSFRPDDRITREELASMLANYAKVTGDYVASDGSALAALPDAGSVSGWATDNVAWAVENGVMGNGGSVNAGANITRAEVAAMAVNYAQKF